MAQVNTTQRKVWNWILYRMLFIQHYSIDVQLLFFKNQEICTNFKLER
jgi:hypothetical protein